MKCVNKKILSGFLVAVITATQSATIEYASIDLAYNKYNKDIYDIYDKYTKKNGGFDINDIESYFYPLTNKNDKQININRLKEGGVSIYNVLDGSYFVYGYPFGAVRNRPDTLTYDMSLRGDAENQYMGEDSLGAYFDNPAFPWRSWIINGKALKDWNFIRRPWKNDSVLIKYKLDKEGGSFCDSKIDLTPNMKLGIFAKYIYFSAKETVLSLSADQKEKSIYYGKVIDEFTKYDAFDYPDPAVFKNKGGSWKDYVYILSPPTNSTWGTGYMFHKYTNDDKQEVIDYITVPLAPIQVVNALKGKIPKCTENVDGCFLSEPEREGNSMVAYVIRAPRNKITSPVYTKMTVWLKQNLPESQQFDLQTNLGTQIFNANVLFTPEKPYWIYKVTYPIPAKGTESGIYVKTANQTDMVSNSTWYSSSGGLIGSSHTTSDESELVDWMPWSEIASDDTYKIKRPK